MSDFDRTEIRQRASLCAAEILRAAINDGWTSYGLAVVNGQPYVDEVTQEILRIAQRLHRNSAR